MPMLGLGTWQNEDPEDCAKAVETALNTGYRHIDTAQAYDNEEHVGEGIENADVPREDVFLATKVWKANLAYDDVLSSTEESLEKLGVDSVDLLYIHWPAGEYDPEETFRALNELYDDGKIDRIGISNFEPENIEEAVEHSDAPIFANQVELHPLLQQEEIRSACEEHDIEVVAYSPLARGNVFDDDVLGEIADDHGVSAAQVSLAWLREKGVTAIPKATGEDHIQDNWESLGVELDDEQIERIDEMDRNDRQVDPDFAPW
ncbi:aldo/keto reductase [Halogeometricum sp. S1BR25-6]|uniref:Aldo/keto reductase n=2 Tax=Halogeometricum salsisoli TaxID=2950536 RepID=A0ABU2GBK8_9EURY|nr:aldo/keto reductase [Halogeometricum sp. S1BR25-6]MDS0298197.1 aldo/keto reductase [Halogeometricum sp. S1BR25-6]